MDFSYNIGTGTRTIKKYKDTIKTLEEIRISEHEDITTLTESGWGGEARDKFLKVHEENMKKYMKLEEDMKYMVNVLEEAKQRALPLKARSEDFVNCITRSGQGGVASNDDEGLITLEYDGQSPINNHVSNCVNEDYVRLNKNFTEIQNILGELEYTSFGIGGDVESVKTSVRNQTESLTDFNESFNEYCVGAREMESYISSQFAKISDTNKAEYKASSILAANGDIATNQLRDIMLKGENGLSDSAMAYMTKLLNDSVYNKFKNIFMKTPDNLTAYEEDMLKNSNGLVMQGLGDIDLGELEDEFKNGVSGYKLKNLSATNSEQYASIFSSLFVNIKSIVDNVKSGKMDTSDLLSGAGMASKEAAVFTTLYANIKDITHQVYVGETRVSKDELEEMFKKYHYFAKGDITPDMVDNLNRTLNKYIVADCTDEATIKNRVRNFMAQGMYESRGGFVEEGSEAYIISKNYQGGPNYRGVGFIQVTHLDAYQDFTKQVNDPEVENQGYKYVAEKYPFEISGRWWQLNTMNKLVDGGATIKQVGNAINKGRGAWNAPSDPDHPREREEAYKVVDEVMK